ncbi:MAG: acyl-CoA dehydrogenase family protein, partial [Hoeflea sp.]|nr:acyl-CoA dehydrogenase family protein [Hoeflea sp.]
MSDRSFLQWPFFDDAHRALADRADEWAGAALADLDHSNVDETCKGLVKALGDAGWLKLTAVDPADENSRIDVRSLCILRETLARHDGLADFAFAMQGLGTGAISLFGTPEQKAEWLTLTRAGKALSA